MKKKNLVSWIVLLIWSLVFTVPLSLWILGMESTVGEIIKSASVVIVILLFVIVVTVSAAQFLLDKFKEWDE
jgi:hypothetical protein